MSYWHQMYTRRQPSERIELEKGSERFASLLAKDLSDGDRKFATSLQRQHEEKGTLTHKQIECVKRMEERYSEEAIIARKNWEATYKEEHRQTAIICANYYVTTSYFRDLAVKIATDEDFVPTQRQFNALTKNKYAKKAIKAATEPPAFPVGTLAKVRANYNLVSNRSLHDQIGLVVENHAKGLYASSTILVNGQRYKLEDRCLKAAAKKKKK
jgi:hypothetical protein